MRTRTEWVCGLFPVIIVHLMLAWSTYVVDVILIAQGGISSSNKTLEVVQLGE